MGELTRPIARRTGREPYQRTGDCPASHRHDRRCRTQTHPPNDTSFAGHLKAALRRIGSAARPQTYHGTRHRSPAPPPNATSFARPAKRLRRTAQNAVTAKFARRVFLESVGYKRGGQGTRPEGKVRGTYPCPFSTLVQSDESTVNPGDLAQLRRILLPRNPVNKG